MVAAQVNHLECIAENLANCTMPGYRRLQSDQKTFDLIFLDAMTQPMQMQWQDGRQFDPIKVDFTQGPLKETQKPLDFAILGDGFFTLERNGKEYFTRNGNFSMDPDGRIVNSAGIPLKSDAGEIVVPENVILSQIEMEDNGTLRAGARVLGTLKIVHFPDLAKLQRAGPALFSAPTDMPPQEKPDGTRVVGKTLEMSNTTIFEEMAETISCMRAFEACQRMIRSQDESQGALLRKLG